MRCESGVGSRMTIRREEVFGPEQGEGRRKRVVASKRVRLCRAEGWRWVDKVGGRSARGAGTRIDRHERGEEGEKADSGEGASSVDIL